MAPLHTRMAMDARWPWHQRSVTHGWMNATVEIFRRPGEVADYGFDPATGGVTDGQGGFPQPVLLYRGKARAATNKDWRARVRTIRGDSGTIHAVRFQVPIATSPPVHAHDIIRVTVCEPEPMLADFIFHVRNSMASSNAWLRNLLCDVDVAHPQVLPPPHTGEPVAPTAAPAPVTTCTGCG